MCLVNEAIDDLLLDKGLKIGLGSSQALLLFWVTRGSHDLIKLALRFGCLASVKPLSFCCSCFLFGSLLHALLSGHLGDFSGGTTLLFLFSLAILLLLELLKAALLTHHLDHLSVSEAAIASLNEAGKASKIVYINGYCLAFGLTEIEELEILYKLIAFFVFEKEIPLLYLDKITLDDWHVVINHKSLESG